MKYLTDPYVLLGVYLTGLPIAYVSIKAFAPSYFGERDDEYYIYYTFSLIWPILVFAVSLMFTGHIGWKYCLKRMFGGLDDLAKRIQNETK